MWPGVRALPRVTDTLTFTTASVGPSDGWKPEGPEAVKEGGAETPGRVAGDGWNRPGAAGGVPLPGPPCTRHLSLFNAPGRDRPGGSPSPHSFPEPKCPFPETQILE